MQSKEDVVELDQLEDAVAAKLASMPVRRSIFTSNSARQATKDVQAKLKV